MGLANVDELSLEQSFGQQKLIGVNCQVHAMLNYWYTIDQRRKKTSKKTPISPDLTQNVSL